MLMILRLSGSTSAPTGTLIFSGLDGRVDSIVGSSGSLSLSGSVSGFVSHGNITAELTAWNTQLQNGTMVGSFSFGATSRTFNGTASGTATIRGLSRIS